MLSIDHRRDILAARRRFFDGRPVSDDDVPAPILNSWRRCSERGFDIHLPPHLEPMTITEMRQAMQRHEVLQRLCRPEIEALHAEAQLTDCIVILTDAEGLIYLSRLTGQTCVCIYERALPGPLVATPVVEVMRLAGFVSALRHLNVVLIASR